MIVTPRKWKQHRRQACCPRLAALPAGTGTHRKCSIPRELLQAHLPCIMCVRQFPREKPAGSTRGLELGLGQGTSQGIWFPRYKTGVGISSSLPVGKTEIR